MASSLPQGVTDPVAWEEVRRLIEQKLGPAYSSELNLVDHHRRNTIPFLVEHCRLAGRSVLEFGAGTGGLSVAMVQAGSGPIEAIEPNPISCEIGQSRARAYGVESSIHIQYVPDTRTLPFENETFQIVLCSSVLQYIPDFQQRRVVLAEMSRVLRPGGMLVICNTGNGLYPGSHSSRWWSNFAPARAARLGHGRGVTFWEMNGLLWPRGFNIVPQGAESIRRWRERRAGRRWSSLVSTVLLNSEGLLGWLTSAPLEAFLPFPELAFRKSKMTGD
jgi:SAM-dependent methyltransferase